MTRIGFLLPFTLLAIAPPALAARAAAQDAPAVVTAGDRVRITASTRADSAGAAEAPPRMLVGRVVALEDSALVIAQMDRSATHQRIPLTAVRSVERSVGTSRASGTRTGAAIGLAIGALFGYASGDDCSEEAWICFDRGDTAVFGAGIGVCVGAIAGFAVGSMERWAPATLPGRVSLRPGARGAGGLAISFAF